MFGCVSGRYGPVSIPFPGPKKSPPLSKLLTPKSPYAGKKKSPDFLALFCVLPFVVAKVVRASWEERVFFFHALAVANHAFPSVMSPPNMNG